MENSAFARMAALQILAIAAAIAAVCALPFHSHPLSTNGLDAGKKVEGRKRHLVVDGMGLVLAVTVTAASVQDRDAAAQVVAQAHARAPTIERLYGD